MYTRVAWIYDAWTGFTERRSLEAAIEDSGICDGDAVLEVAVGTGVAFREILRRNPSGSNVGVDLTEAMLRRAREKAQREGVRCELLRADARALPFDDASFDVVMNNNMLGVVPEAMVSPIVAELFRVLRPGGRLVVVMMKPPRRPFPRLVYGLGAVWLGGWQDLDVEPFLRAAGFLVVKRRSVTQLGIPSEVFVAVKRGGGRS